MDFDIYKNCTVALDQSANEQFYFMKKNCQVDIFGFLHSNGCAFAATEQSFKQIGSYKDQHDLFSWYLSEQTNIGMVDCKDLVISETDSSITLGLFDTGYKLKIESVNIYPSQTILWDAYPPFTRAAKSEADKSNIYYVRGHYDRWVATNDGDQIKAIQLTGNNYLRPVDLLVWMVSDSYINRQKAVWVYKKIKGNDAAWVPKNTAFAEYYRKAKSRFGGT